MNHRLTTYPILRRFFFIWMGIVYVMTLVMSLHRMAFVIHKVAGIYCTVVRKPQSSSICVPLSKIANAYIPPFVGFTLLLLCFSMLLWMNLSVGRDRRFYWLSLPLQGLLLFLVAFAASQMEAGLILTFLLAFELLVIFKQIRLILMMVYSSVLFCVGLLVWSLLSWRLSLPFSIDLWPITTISSWWDLFGLISLLLIASGYLVLYMKLLRSHTHLQTAHAQLRASAEQIEALTLLSERQRLARELHDTLSQGLAGVMMQLQAANSRLSNQRYERAQEAVQQAMTYARAALAEARSAIDDLRTEALTSQDLSEEIQKSVQRFTSTTGIVCRCDLSVLAALPEHLYDHVLRTINEALTNVAHHAQASQVWIRIAQDETTLLLEVRDDGVGFDIAAIMSQAGHYGLLGLRERAHLIGGQLDLLSVPDAGTTIRLCFPLSNREAGIVDSRQR